MIRFERLSHDLEFPIYFQKLPVNSVSIYWLVFVGSADDETVGEHGVYHWFEHIPSRGTVKYPGGYRDTEARLVRHGGTAGAETDYSHTAYYADVPRRVWPTAMDVLTDMLAQPLLRPDDIEAEREIIEQEMDEWFSSPDGEALCRLPGLLWPGHPLGHDQLGSRESLAKMNPEMLQTAHRAGYTRSNCVLFISGNLEPNEVMATIHDSVENLPYGQTAAGRAPRTAPASYGPLPVWRGGEVTKFETRHEDSAVFLLFPTPARSQVHDAHVLWTVIEYMITAGDLGSPLNRIVRESSRLAYSPSLISSTCTDGGYWGLQAQTNATDPNRVIDCFWEVLRNDDIRSQTWFEFVQDTIRGEFDMHDPSPGNFTEAAAGRLTGYGEVWSDDELRDRLLAVSRDEVVGFLDSLSDSEGRAMIFQGNRA